MQLLLPLKESNQTNNDILHYVLVSFLRLYTDFQNTPKQNEDQNLAGYTIFLSHIMIFGCDAIFKMLKQVTYKYIIKVFGNVITKSSYNKLRKWTLKDFVKFGKRYYFDACLFLNQQKSLIIGQFVLYQGRISTSYTW